MIQGKYAIGQNSQDGSWAVMEFWEGKEPEGSSSYRGGFPTEEAAVMYEEDKAKEHGWQMHRLTRYDEDLKMAV